MATTTQRGYGHAHQRRRAAWAPRVATGTVPCWRCGNLIPAGAPWHLGHDDHDRSVYRGPEHTACNLAAAGRARRTPEPTPPSPAPRPVSTW